MLKKNAECSSIKFYHGVRDIGLLEVQPLDDDSEFKEEFRARGERFVALRGKHYLEYKGDEYENDGMGATPLALDLSQNPSSTGVKVPIYSSIGMLVNFQVKPLHLRCSGQS